MPLEDLPNGFTVPTRSEIRDKFQRDYLLRKPGAPTGEGSEAFIDGSVIADTLGPLYADAVSIGRGANLEDMTREQLKAECRALGIPEELPESAATGFIVITASAGGVFIDTGRQLVDEARNIKYRCLSNDTYFDGRAVPIIGVDKGPSTNIPAGTQLKWNNPPAGLGNIATVQGDADGNGLTGGRAAESNDDIVNRIKSARKDPKAGGNDAHVRGLVVEAGKNLGIAVEAVWTYPCVTGSGHYCYVFTLRPGTAGDSRLPNATDRAAVRSYVIGALPKDDGVFDGEIIEEPITVKFEVIWAKQPGIGWVDQNPWPRYADAFYVSAVSSATAFTVKSDASSPTAPEVGKTFAFYDSTERKFVRKRILTATPGGSGQWALVIDATNNASDVVYPPSVNEPMCPFSPSLDLLVQPLQDEVAKLGPGEQVDDFFDEGYRERRSPENPIEWPSDLRHNTFDKVDDLPQVHDIDVLEPDLPIAPSVGVPGASSNLLVVERILAFPK